MVGQASSLVQKAIVIELERTSYLRKHESTQSMLFPCITGKRILESAIKNILDNLLTYTYQGIDLDDSILEINSILDEVQFAKSIDELLGLEGNVRNIYYSCWHKIFKNKVQFEKREKNPPVGMINFLISFGNSHLYSVCLTELFRTRLNPFIGFIH